MSIIQSIKQVLGLSGTASENHFWDGSVPNQLSLKRGTPAAPGAELIKALNGVLSFPNQGQSLAADGYVKLPGGLIMQWGKVASGTAGVSTIVFPTAFPAVLAGVSVLPITSVAANLWSFTITNGSITGISVQRKYLTTGTNTVLDAGEGYYWIAIGY